LYEIDADAVATVEAGDSAAVPAPEATESAPAKEAPAVAAEAPVSDSSSSGNHRVASIHFLGKDGWAQRMSGHDATPAAPPAPSGPIHKQSTLVDSSMIHPMYGRPKFSEAEMEALMTGGANVAPNVLKLSEGSKFGY
jgi:hypothetical protein